MSDWISVEDRLPEQPTWGSIFVLIAIKYKNDLPGEPRTICCGYLLDDEWWAYMDHDCHEIGDGNYYGDVVTHWMPLPEPPKEANLERVD